MTKQDLAWGMKIGLGAGIVMAFVAWLSGGASGIDSGGVPVQPEMLACLADAPVAGLVLGLLRPLTRFPLGSAVLGFLILAPYYVLNEIFAHGLTGPLDAWLLAVILPSLTVGPVAGAGTWFINSRRARARERRSQQTHHHTGLEQKGHQRKQ